MTLLNFKTPPQTVSSPAVKATPRVGSWCWHRGLIVTVALSAALYGTSAAAQNVLVQGSVPSGPASNEVLRLTLRDAIKMALRYNLGSIESGENAEIARYWHMDEVSL